MLLLYVDDVILLANASGDAQKLMRTLKECFMATKLSVDSSKTYIMLVKSHDKDNPCIMYTNEPLETMESFKYIGLEVPSNQRWKEYAT